MTQSALAQTLPSITFDLRVDGTGGKTATVSNIGDTVALNMYVKLQGLDGILTNDRIQSGSGAFFSSTGGLAGDLLGLIPPSPFNAQASGTGSQQDLDGDGDLDIGGTNPNSATGSYSFRAGSMPVSQPANGFFVGQILFTATNVPSGATAVNWLQRDAKNTGVAMFDNVPAVISYSEMSIQSAAPVVISGVPISVGESGQPISGVYEAHLNLGNSNRIVPAGEKLTVKRGLSISAGGILSAAGAASDIRVNDTTSANDGGTLQIGPISIGTTTAGTFTQNAGVTRAGDATIGGLGNASTMGVVGGSFSAGATTVGPGADSSLEQQGGLTSLISLRVADESAAKFLGGNSIIRDLSTIQSGGSMTVDGGNVEFGKGLLLGDRPGVPATVTVQSGELSVGEFSRGLFPNAGQFNFVQNGGRVNASPVISAPSGPNNPATYTLNDGGLAAATLQIGGGQGPGGAGSGAGTLRQNGGSIEAVYLLITTKPEGLAQYELSSGTVTSKRLDAGVSTSGTPNRACSIVQSGGTLTTDELKLGSLATYTATGGNIAVNKTARFDGKLDLSSAPVALRFGNNSFISFAPGKLVNATNASFTAGVDSLLEFPAGFDPFTAIGSISTQGIIHVGGEPLAIPANRSISGSGTVDGNVTNNGKVSPGNSPGIIEITGTYTQNATGSLNIEIAGSSTGLFDQLNSTGASSIDGLLNVALLDDFVPTSSDSFTIFSATNIIGRFDNAITNITIPGGRFDIVYSPTSITLTNFQAVPEPANPAMLLIAAPLLRRRRGLACL